MPILAILENFRVVTARMCKNGQNGKKTLSKLSINLMFSCYINKVLTYYQGQISFIFNVYKSICISLKPYYFNNE